MFKKRKEEKGSLTIELSLIMPGIIAILILVIFTGYYLHDKEIILIRMYGTICQLRDGTVDSMSDAESELCHEVEKHTIGKWDFNFSFNESEEILTVSFRGRMRFSGGYFMNYLSSVIFAIDEEVTVTKLSGPEYMRENSGYTN